MSTQVNTPVNTPAKVVKQTQKQTVEATKPKKEKPVKRVTFADQIEGNKLFNLQRNEECKKLGYALSLLEKHIECFHPAIREYIQFMRSDKFAYQLAESECKRSKAGNFTPWLLQSYIREKVNNA